MSRAFALVSLALLAIGADAFAISAPLATRVHARHLKMIAEDEAVIEEEDFDESEPVSTFGSTAYVTDSPPEDPSISCFMAPDWTNAGEGKWICADRTCLKDSDLDSGADDLDGY